MSSICCIGSFLQFFCKGPDGGIFFTEYNIYNTLDELYFVVLGSFCIFFVKALTAAAFFLLIIPAITP
jgi:hypothetical protein